MVKNIMDQDLITISIQHLLIAHLVQGDSESGAYPRHHRAQGRGRPKLDARANTHITGSLKMPVCRTACFWTVGRNPHNIGRT